MASQADRGPWLAEGEEKRRFVRGMFSEIAPTYDLLNSLMSLRLHHRWRRFAVSKLNLSQGDSALDVCCGTGDFLVALRKAVGPEGRLVGVDFAAPMIARAREKDRAGLCLGDACRLPLAAECFDAASVGWGLRNVPSVESAIDEIVRALKSGGRFVNLDMSRPAGALGRLSEALFHAVVPLLGRAFGRAEAYKYLPKSTEAFLAPDQLAKVMCDRGLTDVGYKRLFFGNICLHWGSKP